MRSRTQAVCGAISGFVAVAAGAFGAHFLKARLAPDALGIFETGARYQMYHALAPPRRGLCHRAYPLGGRERRGLVVRGGYGGVLRHLYALALTGWPGPGAVTPLGGVAFLAGWVCLWAAAKKM